MKKNAMAGEAYKTEKKAFKGYEFVKLADNSAAENGTVEAGKDLHITYVYKPVQPNPTKTGQQNTPPKTGENFNSFYYVALLLTTGILLTLLKVKLRKSEKKL